MPPGPDEVDPQLPALEDRDERLAGAELAQKAVVVDGQDPMLADCASGCGEHGWLAYPVLGADPGQPANLGLIAVNHVDIGGLAGLPAAKQVQLGE
jgi:hypothetical protein